MYRGKNVTPTLDTDVIFASPLPSFEVEGNGDNQNASETCVPLVVDEELLDKFLEESTLFVGTESVKDNVNFVCTLPSFEVEGNGDKENVSLVVDEEIAGDSMDREGEAIAVPGKKKNTARL